jgi:hypothetical protein
MVRAWEGLDHLGVLESYSLTNVGPTRSTDGSDSTDEWAATRRSIPPPNGASGASSNATKGFAIQSVTSSQTIPRFTDTIGWSRLGSAMRDPKQILLRRKICALDFGYALSTMAQDNRQSSGANKWTIGGWRKPKEPEARNIVIDVAEPDFISDTTKRRILATVVVVVLVVVVSVGVVLSKSGDENKEPMQVLNETAAPSLSPERPAATPESPTAPSEVTRQPAPSPPPTLVPATTSPSLHPTATTSNLSVVDQFLSGLPRYSLEVAARNASSPQAKALAWLQRDPQYNDYELHRLNQRYALAVLYLSTNGDSWKYTSGWLSNASECSWYQYDDSGPEDDTSCVEASRLVYLDLDGNDLDGSIPTELELLTDMEYMYLSGETLSGLVHSEL